METIILRDIPPTAQVNLEDEVLLAMANGTTRLGSLELLRALVGSLPPTSGQDITNVLDAFLGDTTWRTAASPLNATAIRDLLSTLTAQNRLAATAIRDLPTTAGAPGNDGSPGAPGNDGSPGASAYQLWLDAGNTGTLQEFFDAIGGGGGGGSVDNAGFLKTAADVTTEVMFSGKLPGTIAKSAAGIATITMLAGVKSGVCVAVPSEYIDRAADGTVTVHLQFETAHPLYKSEITLMPPTSHFFSRATESAGGFDVELRGNNPQSRILPYSQTGRVSLQFAGVPATPFIIRIHA